MSTNQNGSRTNIHLSLKHDFHKYNVIFLQELKPNRIQDLEGIQVHAFNELNASCWFNCTIPNTEAHRSLTGDPFGQAPRGGVGIIITPSTPGFNTATQMTGPTFEKDILANRYICVRLNWGEEYLFIHSVYAPVTVYDQASFFNSLPTAEDFPHGATHIWGGDFNCPINPRIDSQISNRFQQNTNTTALLTWVADLDLVDLWREQHPTTKWFSAQTRRVDYLFISHTLLVEHVARSGYIPRDELQTGDHDAPFLIIQSKGPSTKSGYWKCPTKLLARPTVQAHVKAEITWLLQHLDPTQNVLAQWSKFKRSMRRYLQRIQRQHGHNSNLYLTELWERVKHNLHQWKISPSPQLLTKLEKHTTKLKQYLERREAQNTARAFQTAVRECETSSKYFYRKPFRCTPTRLREVEMENGTISSQDIDIRSTHLNTWKTIWGEVPDPTDTNPLPSDVDESIGIMVDAIDHHVSESQSTKLESPITTLEIESAIKTGANHSCPGLDGLPFELYKIDPVGFATILQLVYNKALETGSFSPGQLKSVITLLYKKGNPNLPSNYRPIALIQVDMKILDRILNKRLLDILPSLIHPDQKGFIAGRSIQENLLFLEEIKHKGTSDQQPWVVQFLDFAKAYDRVSWSYLWEIMDAMHFPPAYVNWIKLTYTSNKYLININGWLIDGVSPKTGIKQGSPLSPALFTLAVEPMHQLLRTHAQRYGIPISPTVHKALDAFADDTALYAHSPGAARCQLELVEIYCVASNAKLNIAKTKRLQLNTHAEAIVSLSHPYLQSTETTKYLGISVGNSITPEEQTRPAITKMLKRLSQWRYRARTVQGRRLLVQTMVLSVLWYVLAVVPIPQSQANHLNKQLRSFVLTRQFLPRHNNLMSADWVHASTSKHGLGLQKIELVQRREKIMQLIRVMAYSQSNSGANNTSNSWLHLSIQNIQAAFAQNGTPTFGLDFLMYNYSTHSGKQILNHLTWSWKMILTSWRTLPWIHATNTGSSAFTTKHCLNVPIVNNWDATWSIPRLYTTGHNSMLSQLQKHNALHCLGSFLDNHGRWMSLPSWVETVRSLYANEGLSHPDIRTITRIYKAALNIRNQKCPGWTNTPISDWKFSFAEWICWPWALQNPGNAPIDLHNIQSRHVYQSLLRTPSTQHNFTRHQLPHQEIARLQFQPTYKRWIRPVALNVHFRIQYRLLPLGYQRQYTEIPIQYLCPNCQLQVETYRHLFWDCHHAKSIWNAVLQKWSRIGSRIPGWDDILLPNSFPFTAEYDSPPTRLFWWIQISTTIHQIWTERNSKRFENVPIPPLPVRHNLAMHAFQMHTRLLQSASNSPIPKEIFTCNQFRWLGESITSGSSDSQAA